jgi:hypothetical protein
MSVQKPKKKGRPRLSDALVQFRLPEHDADFLGAISMFEERDKAELLRGLFLVMKRQYRKDSHFRKWVARHADALKERGMNAEEIF